MRSNFIPISFFIILSCCFFLFFEFSLPIRNHVILSLILFFINLKKLNKKIIYYRSRNTSFTFPFFVFFFTKILKSCLSTKELNIFSFHFAQCFSFRKKSVKSFVHLGLRIISSHIDIPSIFRFFFSFIIFLFMFFSSLIRVVIGSSLHSIWFNLLFIFILYKLCLFL